MAVAESLSQIVARHARERPAAAAFLGEQGATSWREYDAGADALAALWLALGLERGEGLAVWLPDGPEVHTCYLAAERAGLVVLGIGPRSGPRELAHLLALAGSRVLVSRREQAGVDCEALVASLRADGLPLRHHVVLNGADADPRVDGVPGPLRAPDAGEREKLAARALGSDELFLLNSTSGTTGLPRCVRHHQQRWLAFHRFAVEAGALRADDVFASALPTPFGFGLWTGHFTPSVLGAPVLVCERFEPDALLQAVERWRVSVLAAVTTQLILLLDSPALARADLSSLRVVFTGGEVVPAARAAAFEERSGARVLQFYGSNETGAVSCTRLDKPREARLASVGRPLPEMQLRLFDEAGGEIRGAGRGRPAVRGPTLSLGYHADDAANAALWRDDGWMWLGDVVELDAQGLLHVVGRADDFIIRGGVNISAVAVEEAVTSHPAVLRAAAVAMPDATFGERVCAFLELRPGEALDLDALRAHLAARGVSKSLWPERLELRSPLPLGSGGKLAKGALRAEAARLAGARTGEPQAAGAQTAAAREEAAPREPPAVRR